MVASSPPFPDPFGIDAFQDIVCIPDPDTIRQQIWAWTNGQPDLTTLAYRRILDTIDPELGDTLDVQGVNDVMQTQFTRNLLSSDDPLDQPVRQHLNRMETALCSPSSESSLLIAYRELLIAHPTLLYNASPEQNQLRQIGIATLGEDETLKIANPIYKKIFNLNWTQSLIEAQENRKKLDKYHLALITGLVSLLLFTLFQGFIRYSPYSRLIRCRDGQAFKAAIDANVSLDENRIQQSIQTLKAIQADQPLTPECAAILYDLQYSQAIYIQAGINSNPLKAAKTLCEIPQAYFEERQIQPWISRWSSLYRKTRFSEDLKEFLNQNECQAFDFLNR